MSEIENDGFRVLTNASSSLELLHRTVWQGNQQAREAWQRCLSDTLRGWLHRHPRKEELDRLDSEEYYLTRAFERFWQTVDGGQQLAYTGLSTALNYLQASLHGVLLDTLRAHMRPRGTPALV